MSVGDGTVCMGGRRGRREEGGRCPGHLALDTWRAQVWCDPPGCHLSSQLVLPDHLLSSIQHPTRSVCSVPCWWLPVVIVLGQVPLPPATVSFHTVRAHSTARHVSSFPFPSPTCLAGRWLPPLCCGQQVIPSSQRLPVSPLPSDRCHLLPRSDFTRTVSSEFAFLARWVSGDAEVQIPRLH